MNNRPSEQQQRRNALILSGAVQDTYSRVNRMLGAPQTMSLHVIHPFHHIAPMAPGWTDGVDVYLSAKENALSDAFKRGELTAPQVMALTGLNYHELSHCFYTPDMHGQLANSVRTAGYWMAFNILEDQKVESIFTAQYNHAQHYFTKLVETFLRGTPQQIQTNYALIAGRLFLPPELRKFFKDNFLAPEHIKEIEEIAIAYRRERDETEMFTLIERLHNILKKMREDHGASMQAPQHGEGKRHSQSYDPDQLDDAENDPVIGSGSPGEGEEGEGEGEGQQSGSGGEGSESGDGGASDGEGEGEGEGEGSGQSTTPEQRYDGNEVDDSNGPDTEGGGNGAGHGQRANQEDLTSELGKVLDKVAEQAQSQVANELRKQQQAIRASTKNYRLAKSNAPRSSDTPTVEDNTIIRKVVREFRALERKHRPGWHREQNTGVLDSNRLNRLKDGRYDLFRKWNEGKNKLFAYEITILVDTSGSMSGGEIEAASRAAWILQRAFDDLKAKVTVIGYSSDAYLLADRGDQTPKRIPVYGASGGTHGAPALEAAWNYHHTSTLKKHICFLITDGGFADGYEVQERMDDFGFPIILIGVGSGASGTIEHYRQRVGMSGTRWLKGVSMLTQSSDLVNAIKDYVITATKENL